MAEFKIDLGIAEFVEKIDKIIQRPKERTERGKEDLKQDILDYLEAASELIYKFDESWRRLVAEYQKKSTITDEEKLDELADKTYDYLTGRSLSSRLEELIPELDRFANSERLKDKRYQDMRGGLSKIVRNLYNYQDKLGKDAMTSVGMEEEYNLMTLWERAKGYDYDREIKEMPLDRLAVIVHKNHDFSTTRSINSLVGEARGILKGLA